MLDIEKLLREGKSLDEIGNLVSAELNAAQEKIDAENEKKDFKSIFYHCISQRAGARK